jgi:hypothetical protein
VQPAPGVPCRPCSPLFADWCRAAEVVTAIHDKSPDRRSKLPALLNDVLIALSARQIGATFSLELALQRLRGRLFATIQETRIFDHPHKLMDVYGFDLDPNDPANHVDNVRHATTPELYGGLVLNYELIDGLHLNANLYCFTQHQYTRGVNAVGMPPNYTYEPRVFSVAAKLIVNLNVTYAVTPEVDVYLTGRNLLDARSREFAWADRIPAVVLAGLRLEL